MAKISNISGYPFSRLSAEEERGYLKDIFYKQQYYDALVDLAEASASRFILGQRGIGKSAMILHLFEDMKSLRLLPILIDQYDGFPESRNCNYFLYSMITKLTFELADRMLFDKTLIKKLNATQRKQLGLYIEMFYDPITASHCIEYAENIASVRRWNAVKSFVNDNLSFLNNIIGLFVKVGAGLIRNKIGLDGYDINEYGNQYLSELKLTSYKQVPKETVVAWESERLKLMLYNLRDMAIAMEYSSIVVMFDKIDEITGINGQIEKVTAFMKDFLSDTNLLYTPNIAIIVSLWSEVKFALNRQGVRFDKFKEVDIRWSDEELVKLLNKRLLYYADDKTNAPTFESLVPEKQEQKIILALADKSPRSLLNLLGHVLEEESERNISCFSLDALSRGYIKYCKKFDYTSAQPSRTGKGMDVVTWITRLLRMKVTSFDVERYAALNNITKKKAYSHIDTLIRYNFIKDSMMATEDDEPIYDIVDPRIRFLISRGELSLDS